MAHDIILIMAISCIVFLAWPACVQAVRYQQTRAHIRRDKFRVTREL